MANQTVTVLEADGVTQTDVEVLGFGRQAAAASKSTAMSTEDKAVLDAINSNSSRLTSSATNIAPGSALATTSLIVGSRYNSTPPTFTNGQEGALQISAAGRLLADAAIGSALPAGTNNIGDIDVLTVNGVAPAFGAGASGATVQRVVVASDQLASSITSQGAFAAGAQQVSLPSDHPAIPEVGNVAHDAADSGAPIKIGFKATSSLSALTPVSATADRTDGFAGMDGVQIVRPHCNLEDIVTGNATNTDGTSTQCIAAQATGIKTYLESVVLCNTSATAITVDIKDGTTVKTTLPLPAGSGCVYNPPVPIPGTAATAWNFDPSAAATTVTCSMVGFKSKV